MATVSVPLTNMVTFNSIFQCLHDRILGYLISLACDLWSNYQYELTNLFKVVSFPTVL